MTPFHSPLLTLAMLGVMAGPPARAQDGAPPRGYAVQSHGPEASERPNGNGCAGVIARWQAVQANDHASGNVDLRVYNRIQNEIDRAAALCEAGRDIEARRIVAESKRRHGYPP